MRPVKAALIAIGASIALGVLDSFLIAYVFSDVFDRLGRDVAQFGEGAVLLHPLPLILTAISIAIVVGIPAFLGVGLASRARLRVALSVGVFWSLWLVISGTGVMPIWYLAVVSAVNIGVATLAWRLAPNYALERPR